MRFVVVILIKEPKMCGVLPLVKFIMFLFTAIFMFHISSALETEFEPLSQINLQTYIVYVNMPKGLNSLQSESLDSWYQSLLPVTTASSKQQQRLVYSYINVVAGFAARLTAQEAKAMEMKEEVAHIRPEEKLFLQTTHSPSFLGLHQEKGFWKDSNFGKGVIIGVLDTGITPGHPSFRDEGMPPPPDRWKGKCEFKQTANGTLCNNKIIGARSFSKVLTSSSTAPIDWIGHGTHTSSTAAGNFVKKANLYGSANGTAAGLAPYAHLAIYQVCSVDECSDSDVLAGLDAAIEDGVDVISISMASMNINPLFEDTIALAAFSAMERGIFVACSAGNSGPSTYSVVNAAPWILTVGASTIDRSVIATARLGNRVEFDGESISHPNFTKGNSPTLLPLVYPGTNGAVWSMICNNGSLGDDVKGKIVLCERSREISRIDQGKVVNAAGGAAMFLMNPQEEGYSTFAEAHVLPASHLSYAAGLKVKAYINSTRKPMATVKFKGTVIGNSSAPVVASFSSRGPSMICPGILKPDIIGPGVNILAAWPFPLDKSSKSKSNFNMISGTSMSCPQLSGIAALLKSSHPDWSPAAIKSAIMTTAEVVNIRGHPIADETLRPASIFAIGSGHPNPSRANDPGLIYDIKPHDYVSYLCGKNYTNRQVGILLQGRVNCSLEKSIPEAQLNYPSFSILMGSSPQTYTREVTNVGKAISSYTVQVVSPPGVSVSVRPKTITFTRVNQKAKYLVTFRPTKGGGKSEKNPGKVPETKQYYAEGFLKWVSDQYSVRTPIAIKFTEE